MPRLSKRARHFKSQKKDAKGRLMKRDEVSVENSTVDNVEDCQVLQTTVSISCLDHLQDNDSSTRKRNGHYTKSSRTTKWRKTKEAQKIDPRVTLFNFGITLEEKALPVVEVEMSTSQKELTLIEKSLDSIKEINKPVMNKKHEGSSLNSYNFFRYMSVQNYFEKRLAGLKKGKASEEVAKHLWPHNNEEYRAKCIVKWAKEFLEAGELSDHSQGAHNKNGAIE